VTDATAGKVRCDNDLLASGFVQTPIGVLRDHELTAGAKLVYGALLWYLWRGGDYPGQKALAGDFGLSERSVRNHLSELANRGYIAVERGGLGQPNAYEILTPWLAEPRRQNLPVRPAKSAAQTGKIGRSQERQDSKAHTSQQQGRPATPGGPHDRGLPAARRTPVVASLTEEKGNDLTEEGGPKTGLPAAHKEQGLTADGEALALADRLAGLGVARSTGQALLKQHGPEIVGRWIAYTEHRLRSGWTPNETPAAWLVAAIRAGDWIIPEWFKTPEEHAAAAEEEDRAAQELARRQEEAEAREREEAAAQRLAFEERLGVDDEARRLWQRTRELLDARGEGSIALAASYLLPVTSDVATLATPVAFFCDRLADRAETIRAALEEASGRPVREVKIELVKPEVPSS